MRLLRYSIRKTTIFRVWIKWIRPIKFRTITAINRSIVLKEKDWFIVISFDLNSNSMNKVICIIIVRSSHLL